MDKYIYLSIGTNKGDRISNSKLVIKKYLIFLILSRYQIFIKHNHGDFQQIIS